VGVSGRGVSSLQQLGALQHFTFFGPNQDLNFQVMCLCLKLLPLLQVVGGVELGRDDAWTFSIVLSCWRRPAPLALRQVVLGCRCPDTLELPNLDKLTLCAPFWHDVRQLSSVSHLVLLHASVEATRRILSTLGRQLFRLEVHAEVVRLDEVMDACPFLSELDVRFSVVDEAFEGWQQPLWLQQLRLQGAFMPVEMLAELFSAHRLTSVRLSGHRLNKQQVDLLVFFLQQKQILQQLRHFSVAGHQDTTLMDNLANAIVLHCPHLLSLDF
jgi:hypothetical protein